ncbi:MAG: hypothetical protein M0Z87_06775 [Actinomycetota bacterium]|nr:hypothetical protein [Actinomycetota bacterium]
MSDEVTHGNATPDAAVIGDTANERVPWQRFSLLAVGMAATYVVVIGVPTAIIPNPLFHRMISAGAWNYMAWLLPAALFGPLAATFLVPWPQTCRVDRRLGAGGLASFLAVGCPVCNKVVVLAVGVSGALDYYRPLQPLLGGLSFALLGVALWTRCRTRPVALRARPGAPAGLCADADPRPR